MDSKKLDAIVKKADSYDPNQPRDRTGKWTSGGGGGGSGVMRPTERRYLERLGTGARERSPVRLSEPIKPVKIDEHGRAHYSAHQRKEITRRAWQHFGIKDEGGEIVDRAAYEKAKGDYAKLSGTMGGKLLSADDARELSADYAAGPEARSELSPAVHEPCSAFIKEMFKEKLAEPVPAGEEPLVLFTAGGTGAGKTTSLAGNPDLSEMRDAAHIIYDTNMRSLDSAVKKLEQCFKANHAVRVALVDRDPLDAMVNGVLPRAKTKGRTVPIGSHVETHRDAARVVNELRRKYAGDPRVKFVAIDNNHGKGGARLVDFDKLRPHNMSVDKLRAAVQKAYDNGDIPARVYYGVMGDEL